MNACAVVPVIGIIFAAIAIGFAIASFVVARWTRNVSRENAASAKRYMEIAMTARDEIERISHGWQRHPNP